MRAGNLLVVALGGAALLIAIVIAWRGRRLPVYEPRALPTTPGASALDALRALAAMLGAGAVAGFLVAGLGGRLFMRLMAATSGDGAQGLALSLDRRQFPLFTLWKNPQRAADGYVTGLEPCINLPHAKGFEKSQGRVAVLQPGETRRFDMRLEVLGSPAEVDRVRGEIEALQRGTTPKVFNAPQPGWSPV